MFLYITLLLLLIVIIEIMMKKNSVSIIIFIITYSIGVIVLDSKFTDNSNVIISRCILLRTISEKKCNDFTLQGNNCLINSKTLFNKKSYFLLAVFEDGCFFCNKNFPILNRISMIKGLEIYGVILNKGKMLDYKNISKIKFNLYSPKRVELFKKNLKIKGDIDFFVLYKGNTIVFSYMGVLGFDDYILIKTIVEKNLLIGE